MKKNFKYWMMIIVILIVPITTAFFTFTRVYENMTQPKLSIAIVNEDKGTIYEGAEFYFGNMFVKDIESNNEHLWTIMSRGTAENGLANGNYDLVVILPSDFSQKSVAINELDPKQVPIIFKIAPDANILTDEYAKKSVGEIKSYLNQKLTDTYFNNILHNLQTAQQNVSTIVETEADHNKLLHDKIAVDLTSIQSQTTGVTDSTGAVSSSIDGQKSTAESLNQTANDNVIDQMEFLKVLNGHIAENEKHTTDAATLLEKDVNFNTQLQANIIIETLKVDGTALLESLNTNKLEAESLITQVDDIDAKLKAISDEISGSGNPDQGGINEENGNHEETDNHDQIWMDSYNEILKGLPKDGSLNGIPTQVSTLCASITSLRNSDSTVVNVKKVCSSRLSTDPGDTILKDHYLIKSKDSFDIKFYMPLVDIKLQFKLPNVGEMKELPKIQMEKTAGDLITPLEIEASEVSRDADFILYEIPLTIIRGETLKVKGINYTVEATALPVMTNLDFVISDGTSTIKAGSIGDFEVTKVDSKAGDLKNVYMLDAYFYVLYGQYANDLVANSNGDLTTYLQGQFDSQSITTNKAVFERVTTELTNSVYSIFTTKIDKINSDYKNKVSGLKSDFENKISGLKTDYENKIKEIRNDFINKISEIRSNIANYRLSLTSHLDSINSNITAQTGINEVIVSLETELINWKSQEGIINSDLSQLVDDLMDDKEALVDIGGDEANLLRNSESMAQRTTSQVESAMALNDSAIALAQQSKVVADETGVAVSTLKTTITTNDEALEDNTEYKDDFASVFDNSLVGQRDNESLYTYLSQPVKSEDMSRSITGAQTLLPYFTVLIISITGFFTAHSFSGRKLKRQEDDIDAASLPRQNLNRAIFMGLFALTQGIIIGSIGAMSAKLVGTDLVRWVALSGLSCLTIVWVCFALLKWLKNFGMAFIVVIIFIYLALNGVLGYGITTDSLLISIRNFSPLWLLEGIYMHLLFAIPVSYLVAMVVIIVIGAIALVANSFVDWSKKGVKKNG